MAGELCNIFEQYIQNENLQNKVAEIDDLLCDLVDANKDSEEGLKKILLCIFRLLYNHNKWQIQFSSKPFHKLTAIMPGQQKKEIISSILTCVKLYVQKFPQKESKYLLEELWAMSNNKDPQPHIAQMFVQLFEEFSSCINGFPFDERLQNVIRDLLESPLRDDRKSAYFIMKKIVAMHNNENVISKWGWSSNQSFEYGWVTYVTVLENLDENQSHLILPSLASIKSMEKPNPSQNWQPWMQILYKKLLSHNNILVLRWSLEFFLTNFTCTSLTNSLLEEFFHAANHTHLYNVEGYSLPEKLVAQFLSDANTKLLRVMASINWRSVAFHYWLSHLNAILFKNTCVSKELLFKLAACVRCLQNTEIRESVKKPFFQMFDKSVDALSLVEYMDFVETMYNVSDAYYDHQRFHRKLKNCKDIREIKSSKRFYQILTNLYEIRYSYDFPYIHKDAFLIHNILLIYLETLPKEDHGWFRFLLTFDVKHDENLLDFCRRKYNLDLTELGTKDSWEDIEQSMSSLSTTREEKHFVREKSVDFFIKYRIKAWSDIVQLGLDPLQLLDIGSASTFLKLCKLLSGHDARVEDKVLSGFLHATKKYLSRNALCQSAVGHILAFANKHYSAEEVGQLVQDILDIDPEHDGLSGGVLHSYELSNKQLIEGLLLGEAKIGEIRIEEAYEEMILHKPPRVMKLRSNYYLTNQKISIDLLDELLRINNELTISKKKYFEHSKEHRLKMRIAYAILGLQHTHKLSYWSDELWLALFAQNNQLNISYMYELLIARCAPNIEVILSQLRKIASHTASHQISLISVIYSYSVINWTQVDIAHLQEIADILLPMTMGVNFQVRLHAQLIMYKIIQRCEEHNLDLPLGASLKKAIELAFGDKLLDYLKDVRLKFPVFNKRSPLCAGDLILYVTNAPYDECAYWCLRNSFDSEFQEEINSTRKAYISKYFMQPNSIAPQSIEHDFRNLQRKINVPNDILLTNDLLGRAPVVEVHNELVCVASLIDKIPNLGGLARTCEVFGIKNLVLDSKLHVEKPDFKNLSMTSENNLNISEVKRSDLIKYFVSKRIDGYKIVGAEQTANSLSFVDFKFPPKCLLLLGHEKHGIPADLLGFLDYAVEVPQFGLVRSLNVHVTGALFMWEYCKQHTLEK